MDRSERRRLRLVHGAVRSAFRRHVAGREFEADASGPAHGKVDLLTVVMHELGHMLGYADITRLAPGIRRLPDPRASTASASNVSSPRAALSAHENAFEGGKNGLP